jgi:membrane protein implicated in regulation of membrane protease activity
MPRLTMLCLSSSPRPFPYSLLPRPVIRESVPLPASGIGFAGGLVLATPIFLFARFLFQQQSSSESRAADLVGQIARVTVAIPAGGIGQIRCRVGEELIDKVARTRQGEPVPENVSVRVEEVLGETVIVTRQ